MLRIETYRTELIQFNPGIEAWFSFIIESLYPPSPGGSAGSSGRSASRS